MDSYLNSKSINHKYTCMFVPHIICCFGVKGIKVYLKRCSDYIFFLQRALSAERQVESLREELVAAQNALQVCSTFVSISNSIYWYLVSLNSLESLANICNFLLQFYFRMEVTQEGQAWYVYEYCRYIWQCSHTHVTTTRLYIFAPCCLVFGSKFYSPLSLGLSH